MGKILLLGEATDALNRIGAIILAHLKHAHIQIVAPENVLGPLLMYHICLTVYVVRPGKEADLRLISMIRSVSSKTPLLIYGDLTQMQTNMFHLLDSGIHGLLSIHSESPAHIRAIDALMRGDSYVDRDVKFQALMNSLRP